MSKAGVEGFLELAPHQAFEMFAPITNFCWMQPNIAPIESCSGNPPARFKDVCYVRSNKFRFVLGRPLVHTVCVTGITGILRESCNGTGEFDPSSVCPFRISHMVSPAVLHGVKSIFIINLGDAIPRSSSISLHLDVGHGDG